MTDVNAESAAELIVARTATEENLGHLLDHMDEWGIESEISIEAVHGEWVATLQLPAVDPRREMFLGYVAAHQERWILDKPISSVPPTAGEGPVVVP